MKKVIYFSILFIFILTTYSFGEKGSVVVSSKIDTEGSLLGNIIKIMLEENGFKVIDKIQLGGTNIVRKAVKTGQIDIYPEYTGNGAFFFDFSDSSVFKDFKKGYEKVKEKDYSENGHVWLDPSPANNTWAIAGRVDFCKKHSIFTMEDFAKAVNKNSKIKLAASDEFVNRPDALPAFQKAYDFKMDSSMLVILSGGNTAMTEKAAARNTSGVNFAMAYGTDGALHTLGLMVLEDTKKVQPVYAPCPVVRKDILEKYPEIEKILKDVFQSLDLKTLQKLNSNIAVNGYPPYKTAKDYLSKKGFIKKMKF